MTDLNKTCGFAREQSSRRVGIFDSVHERLQTAGLKCFGRRAFENFVTEVGEG